MNLPLGAVGVGLSLEHHGGYHLVAVQGIVDHGYVARLEYVQGHDGARELNHSR